MTQIIRSLALAAAGAVLLSACGALNALIPDQTIDGGVLGAGDGVPVTLEAQGVGTTAIAPAAGADATVWVGSLVASSTIEAIAEIPEFVDPADITETIALGDTVVVTHPLTPTGAFTLTGIALGGTITLDGTQFALPAGIAVTGLSVVFDDPSCVASGDDQVCTYQTASGVPELEIPFAANQVAAFADLLKGVGGDVDVDLTVTVTLAEPGLPDDASVLITLESLDAVVEF